MQQSNVIFGALLVAFIVFITVRGELPAYLTILRGGGQQVQASDGNSDSSNITGTLKSGSNIINQASDILSQDPGIKINSPAP